MGRPVADLYGKRFGRLVIVEQMAQRTIAGRVVWKAKCDCGNQIFTDTNALRGSRNGVTTSCGCRQKEVRAENGRLYGKNKG
jgi:hypothetical protein